MLAMERIAELKGAHDVREDKTGKVHGNVDEEVSYIPFSFASLIGYCTLIIYVSFAFI
jgi:hypothetical protein